MKFSWPRTLDIDEVEETFIVAKNLTFKGELPSELMETWNLEELHKTFRV